MKHTQGVVKFLTCENVNSKNSENHQKPLTHEESKNSDRKHCNHVMELIDIFLK